MPSLGKYASKNATIALGKKYFEDALPEALGGEQTGVTISFKTALQNYLKQFTPEGHDVTVQIAGDGA
eukprot:gene11258-13304_t